MAPAEAELSGGIWPDSRKALYLRMKQPVILFALLIALAAASCGRSDTSRRLDAASELMCDRPDSALSILAEIDTAKISERERARHAVLMSQACSKCGVDGLEDINTECAVKYFDSQLDSEYRPMAYYYRGLNRYKHGAYKESIKDLLEAYNNAEILKLTFWKAVSARALMQNFRATANGAQELEYAKIALADFEDGNYPLHAAYALLDLGISNFNCGYFRESKDLLNNALQQGIELKDSALILEAESSYAHACYLTGDYEEGYLLLSNLAKNGCCNATDSAYLGLVTLALGKPEAAKEILNNLSDEADGLRTYLQYKLQIDGNGLYVNNKPYSELLGKVSGIFYERVDNDLASLAINFYYQQKNIEQQRVRMVKRLNSSLMIIMVLLLISIVFMLLWYRQKMKNKEAQYLLFLDDLKKRYEDEKKSKDSAQNYISELVQSQNKLFDNLCGILFEKDDKEFQMRKIYKEVSNLVESLSFSSPEFAEYVCNLDVYQNGIFRKLKTELPTISDSDFHLFVLSTIGLSTSSIALIMKVGVNNIYNRRRHLKDKLKKLGDKADDFLAMLK